ncbi:uncharacterized protein [Chanodichthys erythropterus]|uniref:uncharacterized protein n=1 Tax=Chanodichthys erythropterus TaxID=933992 RepID=UPI00351EF648
MIAVFLALKHFLQDLSGHHVLIRTDNTTVVSYINHQGGLRSRLLCNLASHILLWAQGKLLSVKAAYILGHLNVGADALSRQSARPGEWKLHTEVVELIWKTYGRAQVDLFATEESTQCPLWYSLEHPAPLGLDAMLQTWPRLLLYAFPPVSLLPGVLEKVCQERVDLILVPPYWPTRIWFADLISLFHGSPMELPLRQDLLSQAGGTILHPRPEMWKLWAWPLRGQGSYSFVETILQSRDPSTRKLYMYKWKLFATWCGQRNMDPVQSPISFVLQFLQEKFSEGLTPSTLKVYIAAISAYHNPVGGSSVGRDPLVICFLRGALRLRPAVRTKTLTWDLAIVLQGLAEAPFEPIEEVSDTFLTLKTVFLSAISSLKRTGDLEAMSVAPSCLEFAPGMIKAFLHTRPGHITLEAFCPPPFINPDQERRNLLCPVRALDAYVHRAALWRKTDQLFVCYGSPRRGGPASKQRMSKWVVEAISLAYKAVGHPCPLAICAHSTRGMAASKALMSGVSLDDICGAAGWSSQHTFIRFYNLDVNYTPGALVLQDNSQAFEDTA